MKKRKGRRHYIDIPKKNEMPAKSLGKEAGGAFVQAENEDSAVQAEAENKSSLEQTENEAKHYSVPLAAKEIQTAAGDVEKPTVTIREDQAVLKAQTQAAEAISVCEDVVQETEAVEKAESEVNAVVESETATEQATAADEDSAACANACMNEKTEQTAADEGIAACAITGKGAGEKDTIAAAESCRAEAQPAQEKAVKVPKRKFFMRAAGLAVLVCLGAGYVLQVQRYQSRFLPGTIVNGIAAEHMTAEELEEQLYAQVSSYQLKVIDGLGDDELCAEELGLTLILDDSVRQLLAAQNPYRWPLAAIGAEAQSSYIPLQLQLEEEKLATCVRTLNCVTSEEVKEPQNAYIGDDPNSAAYAIIPEAPGTIVVQPVLTEAVREAALGLEPTLHVAGVDGVYKQAEIRSDNAALLEQLEKLNHFAAASITYESLGEPFTLDGSIIKGWIVETEDGTYDIDEKLVRAFVKEFAKKYNTAYTTRSLKTAYGPEVEAQGPYGWRIHETEETKHILEIVRAGKQVRREPAYSQRAASRNPDWGDSYVEVNLTAQYLYMYVDGKLVLESPFVSGNTSRGWGTPDGIYSLYYKQKGAVLRGEKLANGRYSYESPVDYWMPFNRGIGFHDANWRSSFGGNIYKTNGSHGCINMPIPKAKEMFSYIEKDFPVYCYMLEGTSGPAPDIEAQKAAEAARLEAERKAEAERLEKEKAAAEAESRAAAELERQKEEESKAAEESRKAEEASRQAEEESRKQEEKSRKAAEESRRAEQTKPAGTKPVKPTKPTPPPATAAPKPTKPAPPPATAAPKPTKPAPPPATEAPAPTQPPTTAAPPTTTDPGPTTPPVYIGPGETAAPETQAPPETQPAVPSGPVLEFEG